jgi:single-strand DNA-binding protein
MINNVTLMGRVTAAPELKTTRSGGQSVTAFTIAVERRYLTKDGEKITDFINCVAWRNTAEFISKYFKKGDPIVVVGEIQTRKYTDKNGNNRVAVEVIIDYARFVPTNNSGDNANQQPPVNESFTDMGDYDETDLPF